MRYKMELEERSCGATGASSDAGRDHLDASAARFLTANAGLRHHMDEGFKERSPPSTPPAHGRRAERTSPSQLFEL